MALDQRLKTVSPRFLQLTQGHCEDIAVVYFLSDSRLKEILGKKEEEILKLMDSETQEADIDIEAFALHSL